LLGRFSLLIDGLPIPVGASGQRVLALVALTESQVSRRQAARLLWPEVSSERASANLRSVLWRLQQCCSPGVIESSMAGLGLATGVEVDVKQVAALARGLIDRSVTMDLDHLSAALSSNLRDDLLPDLDDDWLVAERTRYRQLRLHALESLSERLIGVRCFGAAVDTALAAVRADPFRESAHKALIRAYLAEGNQNDAYQQFRVYESILRQELGLEPSEQLHQLLGAGRPAVALPSVSPDSRA
jgi:DNA-binding SARP family transcriptional activator